jgi:alkanesulfonate monooxygenase SsuD/methylene tetrahydromethanopterin reductase-like flavin-dependent oxidoreductase (luciferase family)
MRTVEFGVRVPAGGPLSSPKNMEQAARAAEELGFDAVWVHDFIVWTKLQDKTHVSCGAAELVTDEAPPLFYESLTNLAWLAGITKRVKLGVAVLCIPYREPVLMAKQTANIDQLSNGRLILGVGPGGAKDGHNKDFEVLGIPRVEKWARTKEYLRVMQEVWTDEKPSYEGGRWVNFEQTDINPKPVQKPHPPLWGCGRMEKSMDITAEICTGWIPSFITPEEYPRLVDWLRTKAREKGRGDVDFVIADEIHGSIAATREEADAKSRKTFAVFTEGFQTSPEIDRLMSSSFCGSPKEVCEQFDRFVKAGVTVFELKFIYHSIDDLIGQMKLFQAEVAPHFR